MSRSFNLIQLSNPFLGSSPLRAITLVAIALIPVLAQAESSSSIARQIDEEIIVRGELRNKSIDTTSLSVSVIDPSDARQTTVNHLEEVLGWVPNVNFSSGASRGRFLQIRGICLLYTSPSPRDQRGSRMPSSA